VLTIAEMEAPDCFRALARGDADIAISMASRLAPPSDDPRFHRRALRADALDASSRRTTRSPHAPRSGWRSSPANGSSGRRMGRRATTSRSAAAPPPLHTGVRALVARLLHHDGARGRGLGVALVPRLAQAAVPAGAVVRPLRAPAPARHVFAATRAGAERRPTVAAVLDALVG